MAAMRSRYGHYRPIFALWFLLSFFFFFSSPNLSRRRLDVYHTSTHGVALVLIWDAGLKRAARGSLKIQDAKYRQKFAIWAPLHNFVGLYLRNQGTYRQSERKLLNSNISTCPYNMLNFGRLTAEIDLSVRGTPANFNKFRISASLLHRRRWMEVNQTLHGLWLYPGLVLYIYILGLLSPNGILPATIFTMRPSLAFSYIGSVTARHSSSRRQSNCDVVQGIAEGATYIRLSGHHVGHRPTF